MKVEPLETASDTEKAPYPFGFEIRWPWYRRLQFFFGCFTIIPLRIIGLSITLPISLAFANIVKASAEKGAKRSQVYTKWYQLFLIKLVLSLAKFQIFILGISIDHKGEPASRDEAPMIVLAPHSTIIDGMFLPYHGMVFKYMCNPIYVERGDRKSRSSVVHEIKRRVNIEQPYPQLAIFPEGTNSNSQSLLAFKIGAFIPRVPIQPVCLSFNCWNTIVWTFEGPSLIWCWLFTLSQFRIQLTFNYLPVEKPLDNEDPASFAERVRVEIGRRTGLALSKLTFENGLINEECKRLGLPRETIEENAEKLMKACELKIKDIYHRLQEFKDLRNAKENLITFESPVAVHWGWSNGWLLYPPEIIRLPPAVWYRDYAGGGNVHAVGGIAALVGCVFMGPREGRFEDGRKYHIPGHSTPLTCMGAFILIIGFLAMVLGHGDNVALGVTNLTIGGSMSGITCMCIVFITPKVEYLWKYKIMKLPRSRKVKPKQFWSFLGFGLVETLIVLD
ncbi:Oidioi.mRNA.OKI2018_I69.PAR.g8905.t1.cds [Oikopleura dioica]|uniref:Oidioi.mRNA.OKI2018_I69.PAR.g8905.t1.cds n=1 Tax=Oikopleura dioica TaxID=34765 RepID=A0ABN7RI60_OIKDI|nr:Oidioi.mRNA.OKI2018_I69.PAR.g8905.t1.cds [Oikopleura dioica]